MTPVFRTSNAGSSKSDQSDVWAPVRALEAAIAKLTAQMKANGTLLPTNQNSGSAPQQYAASPRQTFEAPSYLLNADQTRQAREAAEEIERRSERAMAINEFVNAVYNAPKPIILSEPSKRMGE